MYTKKTNSRYASDEQIVFPGMSIIYFSSHTQEVTLLEPPKETNWLEIFHCREGRMECSVGDNYCYISPGDLLIAKASCISSSFYFPMRHFHGLIIRIDIEKAPRCLSCLLQDVNVEPNRIAEKFCKEKGFFIARSNPSFEHIFSELYEVPLPIKQGYSKLKILELMLFLSIYSVEENVLQTRTLSPAQVRIAKSVSAYLTEHMEERCTLEQAASIFHVSVSSIKSSFKSVYGVSFYAFLKARKMESAAYMLEYTDKTILEIAGEHGYDNAGKFAGAFRSVKGMTPGKYRQQNQKINKGISECKISSLSLSL